jgi:DNA-binding MarR family transcriptional regulator
MKLTTMSSAVLNYVKENGGHITVDELCKALNRVPQSVNANITDLTKKGLVVREKIAPASEDEKGVTYVNLTDAGRDFTPSEE